MRKANSLAPLADATVERWLTDGFKPRNPGRWKQIRDTVVGTTPAGYLGCCAAILDFDFVPRLPAVRLPTLVVCGADDAGTPAERQPQDRRPRPRRALRGDRRRAAFPQCRAPGRFNRIMLGWLEAHKRER